MKVKIGATLSQDHHHGIIAVQVWKYLYFKISYVNWSIFSMLFTDRRGENVPGYVFDQQSLVSCGKNVISQQLWNYIEKNTIDLVVIRGISAFKRSTVVNDKIQEAVGPKLIEYVTNPKTPMGKRPLMYIS